MNTPKGLTMTEVRPSSAGWASGQHAPDLADRVTLADCAARFDRAELAGPEALARWAAEWGRAAIEALRWAVDRQSDHGVFGR